MITVKNIINKIKSYFAPEIYDNLIKNSHEIGKLGNNNLIFSINDIENKFTLLRETKKYIEMYANMANFNYNFLNDYIHKVNDIEIANNCKKEIEGLLETGKHLKKLFALLETLDFRLTEKLNLVKNYDFDNKNNDEINEKLKTLTKKINMEFEILKEMESYLDYNGEFWLWEECMKKMPENSSKILENMQKNNENI